MFQCKTIVCGYYLYKKYISMKCGFSIDQPTSIPCEIRQLVSQHGWPAKHGVGRGKRAIARITPQISSIYVRAHLHVPLLTMGSVLHQRGSSPGLPSHWIRNLLFYNIRTKYDQCALACFISPHLPYRGSVCSLTSSC